MEIIEIMNFLYDFGRHHMKLVHDDDKLGIDDSIWLDLFRLDTMKGKVGKVFWVLDGFVIVAIFTDFS